jgi:two-component system, NtrC family, sensor kinase
MPASTDDDLDELRKAERLSMVARLASHIAHELGTPLNLISGHASFITSGEMGPEETIASAKKIGEQANKMTQAIKTFLSHTRRASNKTLAEVQPLVERALRHQSADAQRANVEIVFEPPAERVAVTIEPIKLVQIVSQLLSNAIKAMPEGGKVIVSIKRESRSPANDRAIPGLNSVCISVRDQGVGIAAERIPHIFKLFDSNQVAENAGLGLSIAQWIVRENSGWIDVESEINKGSLFTVCLPEGGVIDAGTHSDRG